MSTKDKKDAKYTRKLKYGTMATVITAIVIAIVIIINIIMGVLMKRYPVKLDLTTDKRYELCDETVDFLKNMDKDVEIAVMYPEETLAQYTYYNMIPKILEKYEVYAKAGKGSIDVKYYDITKDPDVVSKYSKYYNGTISQGSVVVYCDEKVKVSNVTSYITTDSSSNSYYQQSSNNNYIFIGESTITSAIMSVTDANPKKAGLMLYMGEKSYVFSDMSYYSVSQLYSLMNSNGYECTELNILSDDFTADDYDLMVIPAPENDFSEDVIEKLDNFLYNDGKYGRNVLYITSPYATDLPNIEAFLEKWNIEIGDSLILDDTNSVAAKLTGSSSAAMAPIGTIADTESVGTLANENLPIAIPYSRPVNILTKNNDVISKPVLQSNSTSYLMPLNSSSDFDASKAEKGTNNFVAVSSRQISEEFDVYSSSVMVMGGVFMSDPSIMGNTSAYNNANFMLNLLNTMTGKENSVVIPQKNLEQQIIKVDQGQINGIRNVVVIIIPLIVVICGIAVYMRRKNR